MREWTFPLHLPHLRSRVPVILIYHLIILDIFALFYSSSRPENNVRPYTIGTTFPNRTLEDDSLTIKTAGLQNSVIVQRWV